MSRGKLEESAPSKAIDRKHRDAISGCLQGKWLTLANHVPAFADHSAGFWRRLDIAPFNVLIPENLIGIFP